mgnify:CR=1 FL=1|tara:strand:- start:36819 stop:37076 length:258 start_codon:yes stop_codon:yes gene_type:complete
MKARHIQKFRDRLTNEKWLARKYRELLDKTRYWNDFERFECSSFFRGYELAEHNQEVYNKGYKKTLARLKYIKTRYDITNTDTRE